MNMSTLSTSLTFVCDNISPTHPTNLNMIIHFVLLFVPQV